MKENSLLASCVNTVEGTPEQVGALAVPRGINSLMCSGAKPTGLLLSLTLPEAVDEPRFRAMMKAIDEDCKRADIEVLGGHTQVSSGVSRVVAGVTALGALSDDGAWENGSALRAARPKAGQDIVMTKWAGMSGTWLLEQHVHDAFVKKYNHYMSDCIIRLKDGFSCQKEAQLARAMGITAMWDLSESGVFGGLWEAAAAGNTGFFAELKKIPIKQESVELCDFVDVNPYLIPSLGSMVMACDHGELLVSALEAEGIPAAVIGRFTDSNDRVILNDGEVRYVDPPKGSAVEKVFHRGNK